jgi:hypothetical protein
MHFPIRSVVVFATVILALTACDKKAPESAAPAALARPVLTLEAKAGRVLVPSSALVERGGIPGVFVFTDENRARFRMVRTGKIVDGRAEILSGLSGGETLVTGDLQAVRDGSLIRPPWMAEAPGAKPSVDGASFTGQTQEQFPGQKK